MILYSLIRFYCTRALKFYFREWEVKGAEHIPAGAVIFAPNHQNAFLDAILVTCSSNRNPYFLARADVFKNSLTSSLLHQLRLLPVYRFRDGFRAMKSNHEAFEKYRAILAINESLVIFPEGNHGADYRLRPLQKGIARIVCGAKDAEKIAVVPVGIHYESHQRYRSRVLVQFGEPLYVIPSELHDDPVQVLTDRICENLKPLMLHIPEANYNVQLSRIMASRPGYTPVSRQLQFEKKMVSTDEELTQLPPKAKRNNILIKIINTFARVLLAFPSFLIHSLVLTRLSDPQFTASVKFAMGMVIVPLWLMLLGLLFFIFTGSVLYTVGFLMLVTCLLYFHPK